MMSFGWRPVMSCYANAAIGQQDQPTTPATSADGQTAACPSPTWFYAGLALAAFFGLARK